MQKVVVGVAMETYSTNYVTTWSWTFHCRFALRLPLLFLISRQITPSMLTKRFALAAISRIAENILSAVFFNVEGRHDVTSKADDRLQRCRPRKMALA